MNEQMAERMLNKSSHLDHKYMQRSIEQYERIKKTMTNNRRVLSLSIAHHSLAPLPSISTKKGETKVRENPPEKMINF